MHSYVVASGRKMNCRVRLAKMELAIAHPRRKPLLLTNWRRGPQAMFVAAGQRGKNARAQEEGS
jgi:hypothetical protein